MTKQAVQCGHVLVDDACPHLCDDFVKTKNGMCYLLAFEISTRRDALTSLGLYPHAVVFNGYYTNQAFSPCSTLVSYPSEVNGNIHFGRDSAPGKLAVMKWEECVKCKSTKCTYTDTLRPPYSYFCEPPCDEGIPTVRVIHTIRASLLANKIGSKLSVRNLILNEATATEYELRDPSLYISEAKLPDYQYDVKVVDDEVTLIIDDDSLTMNRYDQRLKAYVHNYVASCWRDLTDLPLSLLGVEGPSSLLTPDYIIAGTKCVLEVATCKSDSFKSITNAFLKKIVRYEGELKRVGAKFFILIVSPQKVYTNLTIDQKTVDDLTIRMRKVDSMQRRVIEVLGEDISNDEFTENERLTKSMFSNVPELPKLDEKYKYNVDEIKEFSTNLTSSETVSAARILLKMYEDTKTVHNASKHDLDKYLSGFTAENTRSDMKRVSNVPFILPGIDPGYIDTQIDEKDLLSKMWSTAIEKNKKSERLSVQDLELKRILDDEDPKLKHLTKRKMLSKVNLDKDEKTELALSGIGGKAHKDVDVVADHKKRSKMSFSPHTNTEDIEEFARVNLLAKDGNSNQFMPYLLKAAVEQTKSICCPEGRSISLEVWNDLLCTDFMKYCMMMTKVFMELSYSYKHWTSHYEFLIKDIGHGVYALIYNPKSAVFVSLAFPKHGSKVWDQGRLGPEIFSSETHYFTDWASYDNAQLEHFVKFGPYMGSCLVDLLNSSESSIEKYSKYATDTINHLLLLYCNNKTDAEELVTSQRYLFMKLLEDLGNSPYIFVDRLPKVLRSRLTVFYLKRTLSLMDYYSANKITKVPRQGEEMILYDYMNIKSLFSDCYISLNNKVNEFYFGYVVSKERNTGKDKTFKVLTKLIKTEQKFRDTLKGSIFTRNEEYKEFASNVPLLKFFSSAFSDLLVGKFGPDYKEKINRDFIHNASRANFSDLATLKVSSRDHSKEVTVPLGDNTTEKIYNELKKDFPDEIIKRPFCMESMTLIIKRYQEDTGKEIVHVSQLAPWCLKKLIEKGYFDSDQFDKSQHGGEREIHVLEFMARIVQFFIEMISKTICSYFPSETTVNPDTKETFVKRHYAKSRELFGTNFTTVSKSADATTWCQNHHSSHFAAMFQAILPSNLADFTLTALSLWPRKRLSFPLKQASSLAANLKLKTDNKTYMRFKEEFEEGKGMFLSPRSNTIEVISGMFQGILHTTSSLYHTMIQEVMKQVIINACKGRLGLDKVLVTVCQGSDDSGAMISIPGKPSMKTMKLLKRLLLWKERVSPYLSVFCNEAKSSIGTHDLIEYNSEWHVRHMLIKPTFRWVSASQELSVTERFIDRFRIYNNMITECLSGGASTLECAVIQLFQATTHYALMGLLTNKDEAVKQKYVELLLENPEPIHGFFPMDDDVSCGVPGVEFLLYRLYKRTSFGKLLKVLGDSETSMDYSPEDLPSWMKTKDMSSVRLKFSKMSVFYRVLERMNIEPLEDAVRAVEEDPSILFSRSNSWSDEQHNLVLKVFSRGVKESISNKSSLLRMASSSAYILTNKCFTSNLESQGKNDGVKHTLLYLMEQHKGKIARSAPKTEQSAIDLFPFHDEYDRIASDIDNLKTKGILIDQYTKRTSKVKISVIPKPVAEINVIDMCKRKWYNSGVLSLSQGQFNRKWQELTRKFKFLSSSTGNTGMLETARNLNLNAVQTKMFLESLSSRSRSIVLYDSSSRTGNLSYSLSRIYWPNKKLALPTSSYEDKIAELKCKLFSLLTFWHEKSYKTHLCKQLIQRCSTLDADYPRIPSHGIKLKIIRDVLQGKPNSDLIHRVETTKRGMLGSFVHQQKGKGANRKGYGIWQGSICGIGVRINMQDNICLKIVVNELYDSVALGLQINQFLNEASLKMPNYRSNVDKVPQTNCWLNEEGRIIISTEPRGIPIYQEREMKVVGTEQVANMQWLVDVNNNNIRIRARNPYSGELYTILSETVTNKDWTPGMHLDTDDQVFTKWSRGEALHVPTFEMEVSSGFPTNRYNFMTKLGDFNNNKLINSFHWDFKAMQKVIRDTIIDRGYSRGVGSLLDKDDDVAINTDVLNRFNFMMESIVDKFEIGLDEEIADWAAETEMEATFEDNLWGLELDKIEEEEIGKAMRLFDGTSSDKFFELVDRENMTKNFSMPSSTRFFSPLEHLNIVMTGNTLRSSILGEQNAPGVLGILYTICTGKFRIGKSFELTQEALDVEEELSSISSSVSKPDAMLSFSLDEIRIHIANLQNQLESASPALTRRLTRLLGMYQDREEEIMNRLEPDTHDLIMLNSGKILDDMLKWFSENGLLDIEIGHLEDTLKQNLFTTLVRTKVSASTELTPEEKDEVSLHLSTRSISRGTLMSIALTYSFNINLNNDVLCHSHEFGKTFEIVL
nr:RNA-dependent RNA polymerase [Valsa mali negative-strand RNA virus 1]